MTKQQLRPFFTPKTLAEYLLGAVLVHIQWNALAPAPRPACLCVPGLVKNSVERFCSAVSSAVGPAALIGSARASGSGALCHGSGVVCVVFSTHVGASRGGIWAAHRSGPNTS